jgi:CubicO group peptidase (beta-lactamase class C family)
MIDLATRNHTGDMKFENLAYTQQTRGWAPFPANFGLGFVVRGDHAFQPTQHGTLASPQTYGHKGAGLTNFWVDPKSGVVFVCLTAGFLEESKSWDRWQRLSDIVHSAII